MEIKIIEIIREVPCLAIWSRTIGLNESLLPNLVPPRPPALQPLLPQ
jgi:hypothetical protein